MSTGRNTASGQRLAAVRSGTPGAHAVRPRLVRRGADHAALGRVAVAPDDDRPAGQLGLAEHLDSGEELVEVHVQDPALRRHAGQP